jgi:hypothetical protein
MVTPADAPVFLPYAAGAHVRTGVPWPNRKPCAVLGATRCWTWLRVLGPPGVEIFQLGKTVLPAHKRRHRRRELPLVVSFKQAQLERVHPHPLVPPGCATTATTATTDAAPSADAGYGPTRNLNRRPPAYRSGRRRRTDFAAHRPGRDGSNVVVEGPRPCRSERGPPGALTRPPSRATALGRHDRRLHPRHCARRAWADRPSASDHSLVQVKQRLDHSRHSRHGIPLAPNGAPMAL